MTEDRDPRQPPDATDELVTQLLACGGVLIQIINRTLQASAGS